MGRCVIAPFRRDKKGDFVVGEGQVLVDSKVKQVLMTRGDGPGMTGEMPWRTEFGAGLDRLRHQRSDAVLEELARVVVREALERWVTGG